MTSIYAEPSRSRSEAPSDTVDAAIARTRAHLIAKAREDGGWDEPCDAGPAPTAQALLSLATCDALEPALRDAGLAWLVGEQATDGGFVAYPGAATRDVGATASVLAAFLVLGGKREQSATAAAARFLAQNGGDTAVLRCLAAGDFGAVYLALAGALAPARLPDSYLPHALVRVCEQIFAGVVHVGVPMLIGQLALIRDWLIAGRPREPRKPALARRVLALCDEAQNPSGGFVNIVPHTALSLLAMRAAGRDRSSEPMTRAIGWLISEVEHLPGGRAWLPVFHSGLWTTALTLRSLVAAGITAESPVLQRAVEWLLSAQADTPQAAGNQRDPSAVRTGGFGFQSDNAKMTDSDDTAVAIDALTACLCDERLPAPLRERVTASVTRAVLWLGWMQNQDGGYPAFVHGLPSKPPGPILTRPLDLHVGSAADLARLLRDLPMAMGDPSTEDVTARVLRALASAKPFVPELASSIQAQTRRGLAFLREQACPNGGFWGRWSTNYLWATAHVLMGAIAAGSSPREPWLRRACDFLVGHANDDGGFGESIASYREPALAGRGPSMPAVTGVVLEALVAAGEQRSLPAMRAAGYLLCEQQRDGSFPEHGHLQVIVPPDTFYRYPGASIFQPLLGLSAWRRSLHQTPLVKEIPAC